MARQALICLLHSNFITISSVQILGKLVADWGNPRSGAGRVHDESAGSDKEVFNELLDLGLGNPQYISHNHPVCDVMPKTTDDKPTQHNLKKSQVAP